MKVVKYLPGNLNLINFFSKITKKNFIFILPINANFFSTILKFRLFLGELGLQNSIFNFSNSSLQFKKLMNFTFFSPYFLAIFFSCISSALSFLQTIKDWEPFFDNFFRFCFYRSFINYEQVDRLPELYEKYNKNFFLIVCQFYVSYLFFLFVLYNL